MEEGDHKPGLIRSRRAATIALLLTWAFAILTFRGVFRLPAHGSPWILPFDFVQPRWLFVALNVAFWGYLLWASVILLRMARGKERVLVAGWVCSFPLGLSQHLVPLSVAVAIQYVKAAGMIVAFVAAVLILIEGPTHPLPGAAETQQNT
jgi:hypothetical protein